MKTLKCNVCKETFESNIDEVAKSLEQIHGRKIEEHEVIKPICSSCYF